MTNRFRQGDVELIKANMPKAELRRIVDSPRGPVLAHGELTGHAHRLPAGCAELFEALEADGPRLLHVTKPCALEHEEHPPIALDPGWYYVGQKRQYEPDGSWSPVND